MHGSHKQMALWTVLTNFQNVFIYIMEIFVWNLNFPKHTHTHTSTHEPLDLSLYQMDYDSDSNNKSDI